MHVISVDIAYSARSGIIGLAEAIDGDLVGMWSLQAPVMPRSAQERLQRLWAITPNAERVLVVERPYSGRSVGAGMGLVEAMAVWSTCAELLGACVLRPLASQWRARGSRGGCRALATWMRDTGRARPGRGGARAAWKALAVAFVREGYALDMSDHEAEAVVMALWGEEQAQGQLASTVEAAWSALQRTFAAPNAREDA